ncbi:MAG: Rv3235 family protein [Candidatus Nanopelagicus sp.]
MSSDTKKCWVRKIYISQPIEGVVEVTATLRIKDRVRSLSLRLEGVDKRWICTELNLI